MAHPNEIRAQIRRLASREQSQRDFAQLYEGYYACLQWADQHLALAMTRRHRFASWIFRLLRFSEPEPASLAKLAASIREVRASMPAPSSVGSGPEDAKASLLVLP